MIPHVVDIRRSPDGTPVVEVTLDLTSDQLRAGAHAVRQVIADRYRVPVLESADEIIAMRDLTSLTDELDQLALPGASARLTLTVAGAGRLRGALEEFAGSRDEVPEREGDAQALPHVHSMADGVADAHAAGVRAALDADREPAGRR